MKLDLQYFAGPTDPVGPGGYRNSSQASAAKSAGSKAQSSKSSKASSSSSDSSGSSSSSSNAAGNNQAQWETGTGIAFMGQMSAQIVHDVMFKFILGDADLNNNTSKIDLMYRYDIGGQIISLRKLIDMDIPDDAGMWIKNTLNRYNIFNPDECMNADPTEFLQFEGTLVDFINELSNQPFNEVYWTHEEQEDNQDTIGPYQSYAIKYDSNDPYDDDGTNSILNSDLEHRIPHATLHYRQTPFEENQWVQLPKMYITDADILNYQLDNNDDEEYSVFNITNAAEILPQIANLPPVTDDGEELMRHYGYKYMDITSEYFVNTKSQVDMSTTDLVNAIARQDQDTQTGLAGIGYPSLETFQDYFGPDSATQILQNKDPVLMNCVPLSSQEGGVALYDDAVYYLQNHLDQYVNDQVAYQLATLLLTYEESQMDTSALQTYEDSSAAASGSSASSAGSVSSPLDLPVGHTGLDEGFNAIYQQWQSDLAELKQIWQTGNISVSQGLDDDIHQLINDPNNYFTTPDGQIRSMNGENEHVITLQKAGQLAMHYMLSLAGSEKSVSDFLRNPGVVALNPWLGQVENISSSGSSSSSSSSSSSATSASKAHSASSRAADESFKPRNER